MVELGRGPVTIIALHGGPGYSHRYLRPEWDALARDHHLVYYDQRGCGVSVRRGPYGWRQHVADLHQLVLRYRERGPVVLAGSSWGSWLALLYAWSHPGLVRAVVLTGAPPWPIPPPAPLPVPPTPARAGSATTAWRESLPPTVRAAEERWDSAQKVAQEAMLAWQHAELEWRAAESDSIERGEKPPHLIDSAMTARMGLPVDHRIALRLGVACPDVATGIYRSLRDGPSLTDLRTVSTPVLLIRGTLRTAQGDGAGALLRTLPHSQLVTLQGAGHDPWLDRPEQFSAHVERFVGEVLRR